MATINGLLVSISISLFNNTRQDKGITAEVQKERGLGANAGKWVKYKIPDEALRPIREYAGDIRRWHYDMTLPWEEGSQLLSLANRANYDKGFESKQKEFWAMVDEFGEQWPNWVAQAKIMHGKTFCEDDCPSWSKVRASFRLVVEHKPVPQSSHFDTELRRLYGESLEDIIATRVQSAVEDVWGRLLAPVRAMAEKLASPNSIFRDSLVENVRDITALIPALNITNNGQLVAAAQMIQQQLATLNPDTLRENKTVRKDSAQKAAAIMARFGTMGHRKFAA